MLWFGFVFQPNLHAVICSVRAISMKMNFVGSLLVVVGAHECFFPPPYCRTRLLLLQVELFENEALTRSYFSYGNSSIMKDLR